MQIGGIYGPGPTTAASTGPATTAAPGMAAPLAANDPAAALDPRLAEERAKAKVGQEAFNQECQTCKGRKYQDGSNDPGVSFKSPQNISPEQSASVVLSHEMEHVVRDRASAEQDGGKVLFQNVVLHSAVCPECGRPYIAGGETTTVSRSGEAEDFAGEFEVGKPQPDAPGQKVDGSA